MDIENFKEQIQKTGFVLEYKVSQTLQANGWSVINNKYYVDDHQEAIREIDLVAYKSTQVQHFRLFTVLVISCKKSDSNAWVLLSKTKDPNDPNIDWYPVHVWSNEKVFNYQITTPGWRDQYSSQLYAAKCGELAQPPKHHIFAFQEMNRESGKPNNDKHIFDSITSLMKAQAYELNSLPQRKREPTLYQFNLLSIVDTDLIRLDFTEKKITPKEVTSEIYIANYIINKQQTTARVHFIRWNTLSLILKLYDALHISNTIFFNTQYDSFFSGLMSDVKRRSVVLVDIQNKLRSVIWFKLYRNYDIDIKPDDIFLSWSTAKKCVEIAIMPLNYEQVTFLNSDTELQTEVSREFTTLCRYNGKFIFIEHDLPF